MALDLSTLALTEEQPLPARSGPAGKPRVDSPLYAAVLDSFERKVSRATVVDTQEEVTAIRNAVTLAAKQITDDSEKREPVGPRVGSQCVVTEVKEGKKTRFKVTFQGIPRKAKTTRVRKSKSDTPIDAESATQPPVA